ncbi:MAG TPA: protein kinase [Pirellulales bacterium]|nr:protein kinase [Pirellulales bacterium]
MVRSTAEIARAKLAPETSMPGPESGQIDLNAILPATLNGYELNPLSDAESKVVVEGGQSVLRLGTKHEGTKTVARVFKFLKHEFRQRFSIAFLHMAQRLEVLSDQSPHISKHHSHGVYNDDRIGPIPFIEMEYVPGVTLDRFLEAHPDLGREARLHLAKAIVEAIATAHASGIVHRDIKSNNIIVETRTNGWPHPVLLDFGIAIDTAGPDAGQNRFSPHQIRPPEQRPADDDNREKSEPVSPQRADVYAAGLILQAVLFPTEERLAPDKSWTRKEHIQKLKEFHKALRRSGQRRDLVEIVKHATHWDPQKRYASAIELANDLNNFAHNKPVDIRRSELLYNLKHTPQGAALLAAFLVLGAALPIIAVLYWDGQRTARKEKLALSIEALIQSLKEDPRVASQISTDLDQLAKYPASNAKQLRERFEAELAKCLRYHFREDDMTGKKPADFAAQIAMVEDPVQQEELRGALQVALERPSLVVDLAAPFDPATVDKCFGKSMVEIDEKGRLRSRSEMTRDVALNAENSKRMTVQLGCSLETDLDPPILLSLESPADGKGVGLYTVEVRRVEDTRFGVWLYRKRTGPSDNVVSLLPGAAENEGRSRSEENWQLVRERFIELGGSRLNITVERNHRRLAISVEGQAPMLFEELFAVPSNKGKVTIASVSLSAIERLQVRSLPDRDESQLEHADHLCHEGRWSEAKAEYHSIAGDAETSPASKREALFKEIACRERGRRLEKKADYNDVKAGYNALLAGPSGAAQGLSEPAEDDWAVLASLRLTYLELYETLRGPSFTAALANTQQQLDDSGWESKLGPISQASPSSVVYSMFVPDDIGQLMDMLPHDDVLQHVETRPLQVDFVEAMLQVYKRTPDLPFQLIDKYDFDMANALVSVNRLPQASAILARFVSQAGRGGQIDLNFRFMAIESYLWLLLCSGEAGAKTALTLIDDELKQYTSSIDMRRSILRLERARVWMVLQETVKASTELANLVDELPLGRRAECWILFGLTAADEAAQVDIWAKGYERLKLTDDLFGDIYFNMLGSLSGKLTDDDARKTIADVSDRTGTRFPMSWLVESIVRIPELGGAMRDTWRSPLGRQMALEIVSHKMPPDRAMTVQIPLSVAAVIRRGSFDDNPPPEVDDLLIQSMNELFDSYRSGTIGLNDAVCLFFTWGGATDEFGWKKVADKLPSDRLRASLAYFAALHLRRIEKSRSAETLLDDAAAHVPADSLAARLIHEAQNSGRSSQ